MILFWTLIATLAVLALILFRHRAKRREVHRQYTVRWNQYRETAAKATASQEAGLPLTPEIGISPIDMLADMIGMDRADGRLDELRDYCAMQVRLPDWADDRVKVPAPLYNYPEVTSEDIPLDMPPPPNVGGEGNPPYEGPNYSEAEDIAEEMKTIIHVGNTGRSE